MSGLTVLIVDDSSVMRKIVERALRQAGLELSKVIEAGSGREALTALGRERVQLIVSDINMPNMDGLEFLRQVQSQSLARGAPVVMITTESGEEHVRQALAAGAQGYIRKPFTPDQVRDRVLPLLTPA
jgi:two-component system, chemotaxis family, chemotaxis protein CheY